MNGVGIRLGVAQPGSGWACHILPCQGQWRGDSKRGGDVNSQAVTGFVLTGLPGSAQRSAFII